MESGSPPVAVEHRVALEVAVTDAAGVRAAHAGGADRVEVCAALVDTGGITPSLGAVEGLLELGLLPIHVLVRPRPGDFVYEPYEIASMLRDIRHLRSAGVSGVVVGALTGAGGLDEPTLTRLADAAGGLQVTWHRMVDVLAAPWEAVDRAGELGATRILSSGGAVSAGEGIASIAAMVEASGGRVEIMAGGGVRPHDIRRLVDVGVDAIHLSASRHVPGGPVGPGGGRPGRTVTDPHLVGEAVAAVALSRGRSR